MCARRYHTESKGTFPFQSLAVKSTDGWLVDTMCVPCFCAASRLKIITGRQATRTQLERRQQRLRVRTSDAAQSSHLTALGNDFPCGWWRRVRTHASSSCLITADWINQTNVSASLESTTFRPKIELHVLNSLDGKVRIGLCGWKGLSLPRVVVLPWKGHVRYSKVVDSSSL